MEKVLPVLSTVEPGVLQPPFGSGNFGQNRQVVIEHGLILR